MFTRIVLAVTTAFCLLLVGSQAQAWAATSGATDQVKQVLDKAMEIQTRGDLEGEAHRRERAKLIRGLIDSNFLSSDMARDSLSGNWGGLSPQQRSEFVSLFTRLFQDSYTRLVLNFLQKENVEYRGESDKGATTQVSTVIMRSNEHIPVDYLVTERAGRWFISDVVIDGVSIVENYKISFSRVIRTNSFATLLDKMRLQSRAIQDDAS